MVKKVIRRMLVLASIFLGGVSLVGAALAVFAAGQPAPSIPLVNIHTPTKGQQIGMDQLVSVQTTARDESHKIVSVELWKVQAGNLQLISKEEAINPARTFSVPLGWQAQDAGSYRLLVRAFNDQGMAGQAAVDVIVGKQPRGGTSFLVEGETPPVPGSFDTAAPDDFGLSADPVVSAGGGSSPLPQPEPVPPPEASGSTFLAGIFQGLGDLFVPQAYVTQVELEALDFEVTESYDRVVCYGFIARAPFQRFPENGFFEATDQYHWNIADYLGGENSLPLTIPRNQPLDLALECSGYRDQEFHFLGRMDTSHPREDWNGQVIHSQTDEGEGFTFSYRINLVGSNLEAPYQLRQITWGSRRYLHWRWDGDPGEIDGFRIYRDNVLVASVPERVPFLMPQWWTVPPCGEEYAYHVAAYRGDQESPPSDFLRFQGGLCQGLASISLSNGLPNCGGTGRRFLIQYNLPTGEPASMGIRVFRSGLRVEKIVSTHTEIQPGSGTVQLALTYHGSDPITTDQIAVHLYDQANQDFYVKAFDRVMSWEPGKPDLTVKDAWLEPDLQKLNVLIRNEGCACPPVDEPILEIVREADGWTGFDELPGKLYARTQSLLAIDLAPEEMPLWEKQITLTVDPLGEVDEVDEGNNRYVVGQGLAVIPELEREYRQPELYLQAGEQSRLPDPDLLPGIDPDLPPLEQLRELFLWLHEDFSSYSAGGDTIGQTTVEELLELRELGGCHDYGLLFSAGARALGFPAVMVETYRLSWMRAYQEGSLEGGYQGHIFVEVYLGDRWVLVDPVSGWYVAEGYDPGQQVIPLPEPSSDPPQERDGHYVDLRGTDSWAMGIYSVEDLNQRMEEVAEAFDPAAISFPQYTFQRFE